MTSETKLHRYEGRGGIVTYDVKRCIHAAECVHGLPSVFDPAAKPWVNPDGADAAAVAATVDRCPSGALQVERPDGPEPAPASNTATLAADGPTYLRGDLALLAPDDTVALADTRLALCRCGASRNKPLCDGSHRKAGFRHDGALPGGETPPAVVGTGGRLAIRARPNGPLMLTGPLTVTGTNGRSAYAETTFLCRCGQSANKPYCDSTHKKIGFVA